MLQACFLSIWIGKQAVIAYIYPLTRTCYPDVVFKSAAGDVIVEADLAGQVSQVFHMEICTNDRRNLVCGILSIELGKMSFITMHGLYEI